MIQPAVSSSGAVSLIEIAIATSRPVMMPGTADLSTILRSVQVERQAEGLGAFPVGTGHLGQRRLRGLGEVRDDDHGEHQHRGQQAEAQCKPITSAMKPT